VGVEKLIYALSRKESSAGKSQQEVKANLERRFAILKKVQH